MITEILYILTCCLYIQNTVIFFKYFQSISLKQKQDMLITLYEFCLFVQAGWHDGGAPGDLIPLYEFCLFVQAGWHDGDAPGDTNYDVWILSVCSGWLTWWRRTRRY